MPRRGKRAKFAIALPNDGELTATGSFRENGHNIGMVSFHPQLTPWIRLPACSLSELRATMTEAARTLGGKLSVEFTPLTENEQSLAAKKDSVPVTVEIPVHAPAPLASGREEPGAHCAEGPTDG
jgi:hypothetical protein